MLFWRNHRTGLYAVFCAMALIAGEASGFAVAAASGLWPWAITVATLILCTIVGWNLKGCFPVFFAIVGLALAWRTETKRKLLEHHARTVGSGGTPPAFTLAVETSPKQHFNRQGKVWRISFYSHRSGIPIKVIARLHPDAKIPVCGEIWQCSGWLSLKKSARHRYATRTLWVDSGSNLQHIGSAGLGRIKNKYAEVAEKLACHAATGLKWCPQIASLNQAMLLGMSSIIPHEKREAFADSGTVHVFAISGLHVMLIAALANSLLLCLNIPVRARVAIAIPVLAAYVMLTGARPSAVRAALMASAWMSAGMFGRRSDSLSAWSAAAILVYAVHPASVFDAGCTLSFTVMLGLLLWIKWSTQFTPLSAFILQSPSAKKTSRLDSAPTCSARLRRSVDWLTGMLGVSLATWIAGTPVTATLFGKISPVGILANVVMVPLAGISIILNAAGTVSSLISPVMGAFFNNLAAFSTMTMDSVSQFAASIPAGSWDTLPWRWHHFAMWYSAWVACFALLSKKLKYKMRDNDYEWNVKP